MVDDDCAASDEKDKSDLVESGVITCVDSAEKKRLLERLYSPGFWIDR